MAEPRQLDVLLIRTGPTEWDREDRLGGMADLPLAAGGAATVQAEASAHAGKRLSAIYCGPDEASAATASEFARTTGGTVRALPGLREMNVGLWEGLQASELSERYPTPMRQWDEDPCAVLIPDGERVEECRTRLLGELGRSLVRIRGHAAVGVVLRPIALGIVWDWVSGGGSGELARLIRKSPASGWVRLTSDRFSGLTGRKREQV